MTPEEYRSIIEAFGLSQEAAGVWLGKSERTGQRYAIEGPPRVVAMLLRLMVKDGLKPDDVAESEGG